RFFDAFSREARAVLSGLLWCVKDLADEAVLDGLDRCKASPHELGDDYFRGLLRLCAGHLDISGAGPPVVWTGSAFAVDETELPDATAYSSLRFVHDAMEAFWADVPKKKDSIARRVK